MAGEPRPSRRDFLRGRLGRAGAEPHPRPEAPAAPSSGSHGAAAPGALGGALPASPSPDRQVGPRRQVTLPVHRPPGAVHEAAFLAGCTRCNDCITVCPVDAIVLAPARFRHAAGTPMIDPYTSPCRMCTDIPCIAACKPGVLRSDQPLKMGVAYIERAACLAYAGSFCTVCSEQCPVPGAIELLSARPHIRPDICTGCGVCAYVCPAPSNAIVVMPLADRAGAPSNAGPELT
ncbi:MAG: 4Fe-4S dicluster domain-containing protein [Phycisphaerales bacterium]|nr:4Fe-4S dicluster domain-containing protein [Phycisphaerales bacterium]